MLTVLGQEGGSINAIFRSLENNALWVILGISFLALAVAYYLVKQVLRAPEGTPKMIEIAHAIQEGSRAYLKRQFKTLGIFVGLLTVFLFFVLPVPHLCTQHDLSFTLPCAKHTAIVLRFGRSIAFIFGALFSGV